ncbi:hypothetical protein [Nocardioides sp.]|uniref:hypothetical protein n=1 Tax=Nocardioides sp. TaxID=35761 RepID=UPI00286D7E60|nr:hypothetical protein [Nocardioides sp.]
MRVVIAIIGTGFAAYGGWLALSRQDVGQLVEVGLWLAAGGLAHDGVVAGLVLVVALLGRRLLPSAAQAPATIALIVWGSTSLAVLPVLGRFGARSDNPTLLDRPYLTSWLALTAATVVVVVLVSAWRARRCDDSAPTTGED